MGVTMGEQNGTSPASKLAALRQRVAMLRGDVQTAREDLNAARARAEQDYIDAAGGEKALGSNAEARYRALTIALAADEAYQDKVQHVHEIEADFEMAEARLESAKDERREREWQQRTRLIDLLAGIGVHLDDDGKVPEDDGTEPEDALVDDFPAPTEPIFAADDEDYDLRVREGAPA